MAFDYSKNQLLYAALSNQDSRGTHATRALYYPLLDRNNQIGNGSPLETLAELRSPAISTIALSTQSTKSRTGRPVFTVSGKTYEVGNKIPDCPKEDCNFAKRYQCLIKKRDTAHEDNTLIQCSVCKRALTHVSCYVNFVHSIENGHFQLDQNSGKMTVTCGKACYNKVAKREKMKQDKIKQLSDKRRCIPWDRDAVTDGGPTSMSVLLDWIRTKPNYARFNQGTRSNNTGETKYAISMEVVNAIKNAGITTRTQEAVIAKISQLETDYDEAHDWLIGPGSTIKNEATMMASLLMRCRYYYDLYDVMRDRALSNVEPPKSHHFQKSSVSDINMPPPNMRDNQQISYNNQQISNITSHTYPVKSNSGPDACYDGTSHINHVNVNSGSEPRTHDSNNRVITVRTNHDDCRKNGSSKNKKRKRSGSDSIEVMKKAKDTLTTLLCNEINHTSANIFSEWLKANSEIHSEFMEEKLAIRRLEEMKLKRDMMATQQDYEINQLQKQKVKIQLAKELGKNRMELREIGVSEAEINALLPIDLWKNEKAGTDNNNDSDIDS